MKIHWQFCSCAVRTRQAPWATAVSGIPDSVVWIFSVSGVQPLAFVASKPLAPSNHLEGSVFVLFCGVVKRPQTWNASFLPNVSTTRGLTRNNHKTSQHPGPNNWLLDRTWNFGRGKKHLIGARLGQKIIEASRGWPELVPHLCSAWELSWSFQGSAPAFVWS